MSALPQRSFSTIPPHTPAKRSVAHSYDEVATALDCCRHAVAYEPVTPEDFESRLLAAGIPDWHAFDLAHIASACNAAENAVSPDLPMLLGRKPRLLTEFLEDHHEAFSS
jgi:hypothetical protein